MVFPSILSKVEKEHDLSRRRIDAAEIWTLIGVAAGAGQSEPRFIIGFTSMLPRDDVLYVKSEVGRRFLWDQTILATIASSVPYEFTQLVIHLGQDGLLKSAVPWLE